MNKNGEKWNLSGATNAAEIKTRVEVFFMLTNPFLRHLGIAGKLEQLGGINVPEAAVAESKISKYLTGQKGIFKKTHRIYIQLGAHLRFKILLLATVRF